MANIAYFVHGRGRGHAVRARSVLRRLATDGHELTAFGGGHACSVLEAWPGFVAVRPCLPGRAWASSLVERFAHDVHALRRLRPSLVVSDGDMPSIHAAYALGIPSIAVGHGLLFGHCELPEGLPWRAVLRERLNAGSSSWLSGDRVAVHFGPVSPKTPGTVVARPDLHDGIDASDVRENDVVLAYFRDDDGAPILSKLRAAGARVVCFTDGAVPAGVERRAPSAEGFARELVGCRAVVATAGNHLPAECAMLGKPLLAVYARGDLEQSMNAALIAHLGIGMAFRVDRIDDEIVRRFVRTPLANPRVRDLVRRLPPASEAVSLVVKRCLS